MTLAYYAGRTITGTNSDRTGGTWTNLAAGWRFLETDTGVQYYWTGSAWFEFTPFGVYPAYFRKRKWGTWQGLADTVGDGLLGANLAAVTGQTAARVLDTTTGLGRKFTTTATITTNAGWRVSSGFTIRGLNPHYRAFFRLNSATLVRMYMGFHTSGIDLTGDDPLNAQAGVMFGCFSGDTNAWIFHNDTSGATVKDIDTGVSIASLGTGIHKIEIRADDTNSRFEWSLDNSAFSNTNLTADIPAQTTTLVIQNEIQTNESGVAKNFDLINVEVSHDAKTI